MGNIVVQASIIVDLFSSTCQDGAQGALRACCLALVVPPNFLPEKGVNVEPGRHVMSARYIGENSIPVRRRKR